MTESLSLTIIEHEHLNGSMIDVFQEKKYKHGGATFDDIMLIIKLDVIFLINIFQNFLILFLFFFYLRIFI